LDKFLKANTIVSILGGNKSEEDAKIVGRAVVNSGYSIKTGGYAVGAMKGGLIGGSEGLSSKNNLGFNQTIQGVTSADYKPYESATKGDNISTNVSENFYDRLKSLIRGSDIIVITEGSVGTELETYAAFAFEVELEIIKNGKMVILKKLRPDYRLFVSLIPSSSTLFYSLPQIFILNHSKRR